MTDIVLTADKTLMTDYNNLSTLGYIGCLPDRLVTNVIKNIIFPKLNYRVATYGLRRVEAHLLNNGLDVVIIPPQDINQIKKYKPKIVGVSTVDPLTRKPGPWTLSTITGGGESVFETEFRLLLEKINILREKQNFKIIVGGKGACELAISDKYSHLYDSIVIGGGSGFVKIFKDVIEGKKIPKKYISNTSISDHKLSIKKPSRNGHVQVTIGCPRHCSFCSPGLNNHFSISKKRILEEVELNLKNNLKQISLVTEDILLYCSNDVYVNQEKVVDLIKSIVKIMKKYNVTTLNMSNVSISATIHGKKAVKKISEIIGTSKEEPIDLVVGVETGSDRLLKKHMQGKAQPFEDKKWSELVIESLNIQNANYWYPWCSLITGLPDENEEDIIKTLDLIDDLKGNRLYYFIFHFVPMIDSNLKNESYASFENISERRWELFSKCWLHTVREMKKDMLPSLHLSYSTSTFNKINRKITFYMIRKILNGIERELFIYKNNPLGFRKYYSELNFDETYIFKYFYYRLIEKLKQKN